MKRIVLSLFSGALLLVSVSGYAQDKKKFEHVKEKTINRTYPAAGNKLEINNAFGNVKFIPGTGNEIKVNIHIEVTANKEDVAQRIFDNVVATDKQEGNKIKFKSTIESKNDKNQECKNCNSTVNISYEVTLPVTVPLEVENSFGDIILPDYTGEAEVVSKFGKLEAGNLANAKEVQVEFGSADIKSIANTKATFKFSKIVVGKLSGSNKVNLEFCDIATIVLDNNTTSLSIRESYSTVHLKIAPSFSATYDIKTSFGKLVDRTGGNINRTDTPEKYGPDADKTYSGKTGSGSAKVDVSSSFGKIVIGEAKAGDLESSGKSKSKQKSSKTTI